MRLAFRDFHLHQLFENIEKSTLPLDVLISQYFRSHKAIGSKDKRYISDAAYAIIRWKGLIDYFCSSPITWGGRISWYLKNDLEKHRSDPSIPSHVKASFPKIFFQTIEGTYGKEQSTDICLASNYPAPTTVRANPLKTSRETLLHSWEKQYQVRPCEFASHGICFEKKINFFELQEFKEGLFEVQDEASQLIADLVNAGPHKKILDYCAGSGGKTLAFASRMQGKGQVYLHDLREKALLEAKKRLQRASVQNVQFCLKDDQKLSRLQGHMDIVLLDVPCSGSGTLRRNPDLKWKFSLENLKNLVSLQRQIFSEAFQFLRPGGEIVYSTCSILKEENEEQIKYFLETYPLEVKGAFFQTVPKIGQMDGFFGAVLCKKESLC